MPSARAAETRTTTGLSADHRGAHRARLERGKDSALALHALRADPRIRVDALVTTVTDEYDRISMHGVRQQLLTVQAAALGLPVAGSSHSAGLHRMHYMRRRSRLLWRPYRARAITCVAFGDLFLADIRAYRERQLAALGMTAMFPVWDRDTAHLAHEFIALGFRAVLAWRRYCCASMRRSPAERSIRRCSGTFPPGIDPCGENGEFHTFVTNGPIFRFTRPLHHGHHRSSSRLRVL